LRCAPLQWLLYAAPSTATQEVATPQPERHEARQRGGRNWFNEAFWRHIARRPTRTNLGVAQLKASAVFRGGVAARLLQIAVVLVHN